MRKWHVKAMVQGALSVLPGRQNANYLFQKHGTRSLTASFKRLRGRFRWAERHLKHYETYSGMAAPPEAVLELGTGWFPAVPVAMHLCGVGKVYSLDIVDLIRADYFRANMDILARTPLSELAACLPSIVPERFEKMVAVWRSAAGIPPSDLLERLGIHAIVRDAGATGFPDGAFDSIVSNTTLEHIPAPELAEIFKEFHRVTSDRGVMSHLIDMNDHYSYFDPSITNYNFLQYSEAQWRWFNSALQYQNRLRVVDYRRIHRQAGFEILEEEVNQENAHKLSEVSVHPEFSRYSRKELGAHSVWHVSRRATPRTA